MTKDRQLYNLVLSLLTVVAVILIGTSLVSSWTQPQAQSQLNLYESDLLLQASSWQPQAQDSQAQVSPSLPNPWSHGQPVVTALTNYQKVRASAAADLQRVQNNSGSPSATVAQQAKFLDDLDLRLGLLYAETGETERAIATWQALATAPATTLIGLWSDPVHIEANAQAQIEDHLQGWFRTQALTQLFTVQDASEALERLQAQIQVTSQTVIRRLLLIQGLPITGSLIGVILLLTWLVQGLLQRWPLFSRDSEPPPSLPQPASQPAPQEPTPPLSDLVQWPVTTIWQVMVVWFTAFFGVSFLVPVVLLLLGLQPETLGARPQALVAMVNYSLLAVVGLGIIYFSLKSYVPRPQTLLPWRWQGRWFLWGIGGYLVALPLVILISLINQQLLHNQGGGNPLLEIILHSQDHLSMVLLWIMVAVLAPLFEEILFRGFFLTSLTRYVPTWGAIGISGVVFAIAHLNLSDVLPLTVLGCVLGVVYTRSRNLFASMLVHGLWNSGSFVGLLILGSSVN